MLNLFFESFFHKKNVIVIVIGITLLFLLILFETSFLTPSNEQYLFRESYLRDYNINVFRTSEILLFLIVSLILINNDKKWHQSLISYFGRMKIYLYKVIFFFIVITWISMIYLSFIIIIPALFTKYYLFDNVILFRWLNIYQNFVILMIFDLIFVKNNKKRYSFIILIMFIMVKFLLEDMSFMQNFIYFILPIGDEVVIKNSTIYKSVYILFLSLVYLVRSKFENIR